MMFIGNNRRNQMVSDADTLLLYITLLISWPRGTVLIFRALKLKQRTLPTPPARPLKGFSVSEQGCKSTLIALYFTFPASPTGRR